MADNDDEWIKRVLNDPNREANILCRRAGLRFIR